MRRRLEELFGTHGRPVTLIGQSLGGIYARVLAREQPHMVRQVITLGSPYRMVEGDRSAAQQAWRSVEHLHTADLPLRELAEHERPPLAVPATSIYSRTDGIAPWQTLHRRRRGAVREHRDPWQPCGHGRQPGDGLRHPRSTGSARGRLAAVPAAAADPAVVSRGRRTGVAPPEAAPSSERRSSPTRSRPSSRRRRASCCGPGSAPTRPTPSGLVAADPELTDDRRHRVGRDDGGPGPHRRRRRRRAGAGDVLLVPLLGRRRGLAGRPDTHAPCGTGRLVPDRDGLLRPLRDRAARRVPGAGRARGRPRPAPRRLPLRGRRARRPPATTTRPHAAVTQDDYRRRLAQFRADPDLQALHLRHPMIAIWDDHDLADNAWREGAKRHDPGSATVRGRCGSPPRPRGAPGVDPGPARATAPTRR